VRRLQASQKIWTFQDIVEQLVDQLNVPLDDRNERLARTSCEEAYRELPNAARWPYFERDKTLTTSAKYSDGTIAFDFTGGSSERLVTLSGGTWPSDADFGRLIISDTHYSVDRRLSGTTLTLEENNSPVADIAAGSSYTWYRSVYPLPFDFRKMGRIYDVANEHEIALVTPDVHHGASIHFYDTPDTPWQATTRAHGEYYNAYSIEFGPPPSTARTYDYEYEAAPRESHIQKYSIGTVTITGATAAVTGTGTVFPADCEGSILRFGTASHEPTNLVGSPVPRGAGTDNRYADQAVIITRGGDTSLTLDRDIASTYTAVRYTISDPIDLHVSSMFTAFKRMAEANFARYTRHEDRNRYERDADLAIVRALEAVQLHSYSRGGVRYNRFSRVSISTDSG
jgi:hypothetical protein